MWPFKSSLDVMMEAEAERRKKYALKQFLNLADKLSQIDPSIKNCINERELRMPDVTATLGARKSTYGDYSNNARVTQAIMDALMTGENAQALNAMHKEGLHMIAHKMSRIVNGDPDHADSWHDIGGYAKCVEDRIPGKQPT